MSKTTSKKSTKKQGRAGKIFAIIASVLLIAALGTSIAFNYLQYKKYTTQGATGNPGVVEPPLDDDNVVVKPVDPEDPGIALLSISPEAAVMAADSSVTVPVTVSPNVVETVEIDWSVNFTNAESEWATGKEVTDYVTVTPTSDGSLTADVTVFQPFGEQIICTASLRNNSSITASCTVDYACKYEITSLSLNKVLDENDTEFYEKTEIVPQYIKSIGTVDTDLVPSVKYIPTKDFNLFLDEVTDRLHQATLYNDAFNTDILGKVASGASGRQKVYTDYYTFEFDETGAIIAKPNTQDGNLTLEQAFYRMFGMFAPTGDYDNFKNVFNGQSVARVNRINAFLNDYFKRMFNKTDETGSVLNATMNIYITIKGDYTDVKKAYDVSLFVPHLPQHTDSLSIDPPSIIV